MPTYKVRVRIQGRTITVSDPVLKMRGVDDLVWEGNEPFSIEFADPQAPFGPKLNHNQAQAANRPRAGYMKDWPYKYTIICDRDQSIQLDPVVIVDPGPTP